MGGAAWSLLVLLALLWGGSFFFIELALRELPIFTIVTGRVGIAALFLLLYLLIRGQRIPMMRRSIGEYLLLGLLRAALPIALIVWAETPIDSGLAGILNSTTPIFTAILAHFLTYDERLQANRLLGVLVSMVGVVVIVGPSALAGLGNHLLGQVAMLGATCSYGLAAIYGRRFKGTSPAVSICGMLSGATLLVLPLALLLEQPWLLRPSLIAISAVTAMALLGTALAFMLWLYLVGTIGATNSSLVTFLIPIMALLLGIVVLDEPIQPQAYVGLGLILLGLAVVQFGKSQIVRLFTVTRATPRVG